MESGNLMGRVALVTGANSGIGKETALGLAKRGVQVIMVSRSKERGEAASEEIIRATGNGSVELLVADLSSLDSVRRLSEEVQRKCSSLHILINNAGLFNMKRRETVDGYEETFAVDYLAPFLLTNLLVDLLKRSAPARIVNVSSQAHYSGHLNFDDLQLARQYRSRGRVAYSQAKLALILFTRELARRLGRSGVTANSITPGRVATSFWTKPAGYAGFTMRIPMLFMRSPQSVANTIVYLASSPSLAQVTGENFEYEHVRPPSVEAQDEALAEKLWDQSVQLTRSDLLGKLPVKVAA